MATSPPAQPNNQLYSVEAEQSVLGGLLYCAEKKDGVLHDALLMLRPEDFYRRPHQIIYHILAKELADNPSTDLLSVQTALNANSEAQSAEGGQLADYVKTLRENTAGAHYLLAHAKMVRDFSLRRALTETAAEISHSAQYPEGESIEDLVAAAESKILGVMGDNRTRDELQHIGAVLEETVEALEESSAHQSGFTGFETGFPWLDKKTSGLQAGDLVVLAARPGVGKTSFAINIVENALRRSQNRKTQLGPIIFFSMEMPGIHIARRMLSSLAGVDLYHLSTGKMSAPEWDKVHEHVRTIKDTPFYIDSSSLADVSKIRHNVNQISHQHNMGPSLVAIDYLQLMGLANAKGFTMENRNQEISIITRNLKSMAKEWGCPLLLLSQLSRPPKKSGLPRPTLSDLRDSGAIEQDADIVLFLHPSKDGTSGEYVDSTDVELIIGKHRNGSLGARKLKFFGKRTQFQELVEDGGDDYENDIRQGNANPVDAMDMGTD